MLRVGLPRLLPRGPRGQLRFYKSLARRLTPKMPICRSRPKTAWEVVDRKAVAPVLVYDEFEDMELDRVSPVDVRGTYVFDINGGSGQVQKALIFARQKLMEESAKNGYNVFLLEGWQVTTFRNGKTLRLEVQYQARPARGVGDFVSKLSPPYMDMVRFVL